MQHDSRDEGILEFLKDESQKSRRGWCGKELGNARTIRTNQGPAHCRACKRAGLALRKVEGEIRALPKDAADFDRQKLERERNSHEWVQELRKGFGEERNGIFNFSPTGTVELERDFNCIGRDIGGKKDIYGAFATRLGHWFTDAQIRLLRYLFWQARAANSQNMSVKRARQVALHGGRCAIL